MNNSIIYTKETTFRDKFFWWLMIKAGKMFHKNPENMVSGWWQAWTMDYKAYKYIKDKVPTNWMWLTQTYVVNHYEQLCSLKGLSFGFSKPVISHNEKGNRVCFLSVVLLQDGRNKTSIDFKFVEKEHNYCKM